MNDIANGDLTGLTDTELADALLAAADGNSYEDAEMIVFSLNEIADRLDLDPDETEQGFTHDAQRAVDEFVAEHRTGSTSKTAGMS